MSDEKKEQLESQSSAGRPSLDGSLSVNRFGETIAFGSPSESTAESMPNAIQPEVGTVVGRYEIREILGHGSFGSVYRAYDSQLDRQVAIKVPRISAEQKTLEEIQVNFLQEARQVAQITHPNIVTVFDVGVENGICHIVSDFLDGLDLNHWLEENPPSWKETARIIAALSDALAAAHARNIIHRDVKPANIIMTQRAEGWAPILVDFGLAVSDSARAQRGQVTGTPNYLSPEQARGEGHRIDGRTDIHALGTVLYLALSRRLPFQADTIKELLRAIIEDQPRPPRQFVHGLPREIERICLKAMAKQLSDRYTTAGDLAADLRALLKQTEASQSTALATTRDPSSARTDVQILIADDEVLSRFKLENDLNKWGHQVTVAEDGEQAWRLFQQHEYSIVITDWMMPNVDGLELVRRIRASDQADYVYVIMLTAKAEKHDIVVGMGAGADDFLAKPFHRDELQVRLRAGMRITQLNRELNEINQNLQQSQQAAAQIQRSILPVSMPEVAGVDFAWGHIRGVELGGDMLNIVTLDDQHIGLYLLDVAGNGVPAALLATTLSRIMAPGSDPNSLLMEQTDDRADLQIRDPAAVASELNKRFADTLESNQFFTLVYGILDIEECKFCFTSAGHPPILHQRAGDAPAMLDISEFPIGMAPADVKFRQQSVDLSAGDRLVMISDGLTDALNESGEVFGAAKFLECIGRRDNTPLQETIDGILEDVNRWRGESSGQDDVSMLALSVI
jgi:sigma-B regulation protein RsbU (phosphoserine phosphatase)